MTDVELDDLPPSAKYVRYVLEHDGAHTPTELEEHTGMSPKTIQSALRRLADHGVVTADRDPADLRRKRYELDE